MSKNESRLSVKLRRGRPVIKHGGYSFLTRGTLPESRSYLLRYLTAAREGLIEDIGGTEEAMSTAQIILIDRCISLLGTLRLIEEHIKEVGAFREDELHPALGKNYIAFTNSLQRILALLGIERQSAEVALTPLQLARQIDQEREEAASSQK